MEQLPETAVYKGIDEDSNTRQTPFCREQYRKASRKQTGHEANSH